LPVEATPVSADLWPPQLPLAFSLSMLVAAHCLVSCFRSQSSFHSRGPRSASKLPLGKLGRGFLDLSRDGEGRRVGLDTQTGGLQDRRLLRAGSRG
jgi:hypothetical protein